MNKAAFRAVKSVLSSICGTRRLRYSLACELHSETSEHGDIAVELQARRPILQELGVSHMKFGVSVTLFRSDRRVVGSPRYPWSVGLAFTILEQRVAL